MHEYGKTSWEGLWEKLEQAGNVGLDYVINPSLYPHIIDVLANNPKSIVADFGCGTNLMGIQILFGYEDSVPAFHVTKDAAMEIGKARFNTLLYIGIEGSDELVHQSNKYLRDIGQPKSIATVQSHIDSSLDLFDPASIDLCVSRNFLMHLSVPEFDAHMAYVARILKPGGKYVFTTLNPAYELKKVAGHDSASNLKNGDRYEFIHGKAGEHGVFYHYYKTPEFIKETIEKHFLIESIEPCLPISDRFKGTHARYYDIEPMAHTYALRVR